MQSFLQFVVLGLGAGAAYALFAQGAVLIYRGSGLVNFGQGAIGTLAAYLAFVELRGTRDWPTVPALLAGVAAAALVAWLFQQVVLRRLRNAAAIVRVIATIGLLGLLHAGIDKRYGSANVPVDSYLPDDVFDLGGVKVQEERLYLIGITVAVTVVLWAWTRYTRVGLAITASAQNERAVRTLGWSPDRLAALTWGAGGALAGVAAVLAAPLTGLSVATFTIVVTVAGLAAALLGGFHSFPMTLLGGLIVGLGETLATAYKGDVEDFFGQDLITGLNRFSAFAVILLVVVIRGRGLPLRSHVADKLPRLGTGEVNITGLLTAAGVVLLLLFTVMGDSWAQATYISLAAGIMVLSIVVLTGYAGQISLAQWAFAGIGALIAGRLIRADVPVELAMILGVLMTIPVGLLFALPALRTRGVNLAVLTLGLGFSVSEMVFANARYLGDVLDAGTRVGLVKIFGWEVDAFNHPKAWAVVNLAAFVLLALLVANLRRSRTGRRLIAVRTNERAAASLGISVFGVKLYAFAISSGLAAAAGILVAFRSRIIQYGGFNVFESINSMGFAVIGGLGYVLGGVFAAPSAVGGWGTRVVEDWLHLGDKWDLILGAILVLLILLFHQNGIADIAVSETRKLWPRLRLATRPKPRPPLPSAAVEPVPPATLEVSGLSVNFGAVLAVDRVSFEVNPGEVVGLIGPNGAGKTSIIDAVTGFVRSSAGKMSVGGARVDRLSPTNRARLGLRRSFQSLELFEDITVEQNIRAGAERGTRKLSWISDLFWPGHHELPSTAVAAIQGFALEESLDRLPSELHYGQRRLVGIARAVASGPSIIMLDEPAAGLDEVESRELASLIRSLADERNMGVLLVEHDVGLVMSTCDRVVCIDFGRVIADGRPEEVREHPDVVKAYLGTEGDAVQEAEPERGSPA